MLALAKADLNLRTVLEIRDRSIEAYREIMRMQL
jgi:flagellar hook-basal body complex protein FliE